MYYWMTVLLMILPTTTVLFQQRGISSFTFVLNLILTANSLAYCQGAQRDAWLPLLLPDAISYGRLINITKNFTFQNKKMM